MAEPREAPHRPAAFINALAEEGTKDEAIQYLQKEWNENCQLREAARWIPVTERLPDDEMTVMIATTDCDEPVWLGWHADGGWCSVDAVPVRVTHWKPIPEAPNG